MINEFKYGQNWKMLLSPLSLSLYSTFKAASLSRYIIVTKKVLELLNFLTYVLWRKCAI